MQDVEIYLGGFWLLVSLDFGLGFWTMRWSDKCNYDAYDDAVWEQMRERFPELMLGDGQDYAVSYPYTRLPAFRESQYVPG